MVEVSSNLVAKVVKCLNIDCAFITSRKICRLNGSKFTTFTANRYEACTSSGSTRLKSSGGVSDDVTRFDPVAETYSRAIIFLCIFL